MAVMQASEFVRRLKEVAEKYETLYVYCAFGAPLTAENKARYIKEHSYNKKADRSKMINAADEDTFAFDCSGLIKGILWDWDGDLSRQYGGANYASNGVPDIGANFLIKECTDVSSDFSNLTVGEALWKQGHIGVYIGDGLAVECTPSWKNGVQITAVANMGSKSGYNSQKWSKHGKLPYIEYDVKTVQPKAEVARKKDSSLSGTYLVNAPTGLHIRAGASTKKTSFGVLKNSTKVTNYGYFNVDTDGTKWLYVVANGKTGYCSMKYLKKC